MWQLLQREQESYSTKTFNFVVKKIKHKPSVTKFNSKEKTMAAVPVLRSMDEQVFLTDPLPQKVPPKEPLGVECVSPPSPKGVEEFDLASSCGVEPFEDFFADERNPFRVHVATQTASLETSEDIARLGPELTLGHLHDAKVTSTPSEDIEVDHALPDCLSGAAHGCEVPTLLRKTQAPEEIGQLWSSQDTFYSKNQPMNNAVVIPDTRYTHIQEIVTPKMRLYIDDYDTSFFCVLMQHILGKSCIVKLDIHRGTDRKRTASEMALLFQVIQSLSHLHTLHLSNVEPHDLDTFHEAIFGHRKLKQIRLRMMSGSIDTTTLRTLNTLPSLADVSLETKESFDMSLLLRSTTIRKLHIGGMHSLSNAHVMAMVPQLECNTVLQELDLEPQLSFLGFKFLAHTLRINRSVHVLQVNIESTASLALVNQVMNEIATVLTMNSSLRSLKNINHEKLRPSANSCRRILRALESNMAIEHFHLFYEDSSFTARKKNILLKYECPVDTSRPNDTSKTTDGSVDTTATINVLCSAFEALSFEPIVSETKRIFANARTKGGQAFQFIFGETPRVGGKES